jgi:hypothetical protein
VRRSWKLYAAYSLVALAALLLRALALGRLGSTLVFPYFVSPLRADFPQHLWVQFRGYSESLLLASDTFPFLQLRDLPARTSVASMLLAGAALVGLVLLAWRDRRALVLVGMGVLTWLPTSIVYYCERYILLPSVAVAALFALALARLRRPAACVPAILVSIAWIGWQAYRLHGDNDFWMNQPRQPKMVNAHLTALEGKIAPGARILIVNYPGDWLHAQFAEQLLRVHFEDPTLQVRILTVMPLLPTLGAGPETERESEYCLILKGERLRPNLRAGLLHRPDESSPLVDGFPWVDLTTGTRVTGDRLGFGVEVLRGRAAVCTELRFELERPVEEYTILLWSLHPDLSLSLYERARRAPVQILAPSSGQSPRRSEKKRCQEDFIDITRCFGRLWAWDDRYALRRPGLSIRS